MKLSDEEASRSPVTGPSHNFDAAAQAVPAVEVQPHDRRQGQVGAF
jgi:hypothetical protein